MGFIPYFKLPGIYVYFQIYVNTFLSHHFPVSMALWDAWAYVTSQNLREGSTC